MQQQPYPQQSPYPPQAVYPPQAAYPQSHAVVAPQPQHTQPQVQTTVYQPTQHQTKTWEGYKATASNVLGWMQIVIAFLCIIFNSIGIHMQRYRDSYNSEKNGGFFVGAGIWCAAFFFLSGGFAIGAGKHKTTCMIVTNMVMSIVSVIFGFALLGTAAAIVGEENSPFYGYFASDRNMRKLDSIQRTSLAMGTLMLLLSLIEIICCLVSSGLCCAAVCCGRRNAATTMAGNTTTIQYMNTPAGVPQTVMMSPQAVPGVQPQAVPGVQPQPVPGVQPQPVPGVQPQPGYMYGQQQAQPSYNPSYPQQGYPIQQPGIQTEMVAAPTAPPPYSVAP